MTGGPFPGLTVVGVDYPSDDRRRGDHRLSLPPLRFGGAGRFLAALAVEVVPRADSPTECRSAARTVSWLTPNAAAKSRRLREEARLRIV